MNTEYLRSLRDTDSFDVSREILDYMRGHESASVSGMLSFAAVTAILYIVDGLDLSSQSVTGCFLQVLFPCCCRLVLQHPPREF